MILMNEGQYCDPTGNKIYSVVYNMGKLKLFSQDGLKSSSSHCSFYFLVSKLLEVSSRSINDWYISSLPSYKTFFT